MQAFGRAGGSREKSSPVRGGVGSWSPCTTTRKPYRVTWCFPCAARVCACCVRVRRGDECKRVGVSWGDNLNLKVLSHQ